MYIARAPDGKISYRCIGQMSVLIVSVMLVCSQAHADSFPFTDVPSTDPTYSAVDTLWSLGIIRDDGTHMYRPDAPATRADIVAMAMEASCDQCLDPSIGDVLSSSNPFNDVPSTHPDAVCIAHAYSE